MAPDTRLYSEQVAVSQIMRSFKGQFPFMKKIEVAHDGKLVFGFRISYNNTPWVQQRIGKHVNRKVKYEAYEFSQGEYITKFGMRSGGHVDALIFETSKGVRMQMGGSGGGEQMYTLPGNNPRVLCLEAFMGGHLQGLNILYCVQ